MTLTRSEFLKYLAGAIVGVGALGLKCTGPSEEEQRKRHKEEWKDQEKSQREKHKLEHGLSIDADDVTWDPISSKVIIKLS